MFLFMYVLSSLTFLFLELIPLAIFLPFFFFLPNSVSFLPTEIFPTFIFYPSITFFIFAIIYLMLRHCYHFLNVSFHVCIIFSYLSNFHCNFLVFSASYLVYVASNFLFFKKKNFPSVLYTVFLLLCSQIHVH